MPTAPGAESNLDSFQREIRTFGSEASDFLGRLEDLLEQLDHATPEPGKTRAHSFASAYVAGAVDDFRSARDLLRLAADVSENEIRRVESKDKRSDDSPPLELKARLTGCVSAAYSIVQELEHIERDLVLGSENGELLAEGPPTAEGMTYGLLRAAHMTLYEAVGLLLRAASQDEDEIQEVRSLLQLARDVRVGAEWRERSDDAFSRSLTPPSAMPATPIDSHGESNAGQTGSRQAESAWSAVPDAERRMVSSLERRAKELYVAARAVEFSRGESFLAGKASSDEAALGDEYQALGVAVKSLRLSSSLLRQAWLPQKISTDRDEALEPYAPSIRTLMRKAFAVTIAAAKLKALLIPAQAKLPEMESSVNDIGRSLSILGKLVELLVFRMGLTTQQTARLWQVAHSDADRWQDES